MPATRLTPTFEAGPYRGQFAPRLSAEIPPITVEWTWIDPAVTSWALNLPRYLQPGNLLIAFIASDRNTPTTVTTPAAGWKPIPGTVATQNELGAGDCWGDFWHKILQPGDPELSYTKPTFVLASASLGLAVIWRCNDAHLTNPINVARSLGTPTTASHQLPTINPSIDGCRIVAGATVDKTSSTVPGAYWTPPVTWTERIDIEGPSLLEVALADTRQATAAPITGTFVGADTDGGVVFIVAVNPRDAVIVANGEAVRPPTLHPGLGPSLFARFAQPRPRSTEIPAQPAGASGAADTPAHPVTTATGARTATAAGAAATRPATASTGSKQSTGASATVQRSTVALAGSKQASAAGVTVGHSTTRATAPTPVIGAAVTVTHATTASTGKRSATAGTSVYMHATTSDTGKRSGAGVGLSSVHPVTVAAGVHSAVGAGRANARVETVSTKQAFFPPARGVVTETSHTASLITPATSAATGPRSGTVTTPGTSRLRIRDRSEVDTS